MIINELSYYIWKNRFNYVIHYIDYTLIYFTLPKSVLQLEKTIEFERNNRIITLMYYYIKQYNQPYSIIYKCIGSYSSESTPNTSKIHTCIDIWKT